jgi:hypothetical protein
MGAGNYNQILVYKLIKIQMFDVVYIVAKISLKAVQFQSICATVTALLSCLRPLQPNMYIYE